MADLARLTRAALAAAAFALAAATASAHHGWSWTTGGNIDLRSVIVEARLGNPHGVLTVEVGDETWTVEVGQPWRNERAGLRKGDLAPGVEFRAIGQPAADGATRMKVERLYLDGREYDLYPGRD